MKTRILIAGILATGAALQAQSVFFANSVAYTTTPTATVIGPDGTGVGPDFLAELYLIGPGQSLIPIGQPIPFKTGAKRGLFFDPKPRVTPLAAGALGTFEVGAWNASSGPTLGQAQTTPGGVWGLSAPVTIFVGNDADPNVPVPGLSGLQSFTVSVCHGICPEPSTFALGALGLGALLLRRRRRSP